MTTAVKPELRELALAELQPAKDNLRGDVGDVADLAESMKDGVGVLEPIIATPENGHYKIVAGHRRFAAAKLAGLTVVPVIVREFDEQTRVAAMLIENLQHEELSPLEEAAGYRRLVDEFKLTQTEIAARVGRGQAHISKRLALLGLPAKVQTALHSGGITIQEALQLARLNELPKRLEHAFTLTTKQNWPADHAVDHELDEHKFELKVAAAKEKLTADGVKVVELRKTNWGRELPKGMAKLADGHGYRYGYGEVVEITPAKHAKEPCHAATIDQHDAAVVYLCTKPSRHKTGGDSKASEDARDVARETRAKEKRDQLRARAKNVELGQTLTAKLVAPKIDARNMRLLADLLMVEIGTELSQCSFRYTDEASQTVIEKKDGTVSRIVHVEGSAARKLLDDRLAAAKTPEEIMGVLLQALIAARYVDRKAVPQSQRFGYVGSVHSEYGPNPCRAQVEAIAGAAGVIAKRPASRRRAAA